MVRVVGSLLLGVCALAGWPESAAARGPADARELEALVDAVMAEQMAELHVPGAVFAFVKDGEVLLSKGYGVTRLDDGAPVDPDTTVFRMASVSKVFTTTAIMQLWEAGRLDLDADVNRYLSTMRIADAFDAPVRIWHLMSHTAGFDDKYVGIAARHADELSLERFLRLNQPQRVMPPGHQISYSNYGNCLLGRVVEEITGEPFERYVDAHILAPLGMRHSSFAMTPALHEAMATGYLGIAGSLRAVPEFTVNMVPSSTLVSSAGDMAKFLRAHLGDGALYDAQGPREGTRILAPDTARRMHRTLFTQHPRLGGNAHGFWERDIAGLRLLEHGGEWFGYNSWLVLIPEENDGLFLAHTGGDVRLRTRLGEALVRRFYPPEDRVTAPRAIAQDSSRFAGNYQSNRYARSTFEKAISLMEHLIVRLNAQPDGSLTLTYPGDFLPPRRFVPVGDNLFARDDGETYLAFDTDDDGRVRHLYAHVFDMPIVADPVDTLSLPNVQLHTGLAAAGVTFSGVLALPLLRRWRRRRPAVRESRWTEPLAFALIAVHVAFLIGTAIVLEPPWFVGLVFGWPTGLSVVLTLPVVAFSLSVILAVAVARDWLRGHGSLLPRVYISVLTLASFWFVHILSAINWFGG